MTGNKTTSFVFIESGIDWKFRFLSKPAGEKRAARIAALSPKRQMVSSKSVHFDTPAGILHAGLVSDMPPDIAPLIPSVRAQYA